MKKIVGIIFVLVLFMRLLAIVSFAEANNSNIKASLETHKKIVAIVLDDSTSMVRNDEDKVYTSRWVEADYAVRALAAMMNVGDELCFYALGDEEHKYVQITDSLNCFSELYKKLDSTDFKDETHFNTVETAVEDLASKLKEDSEAEGYLVVITDGNFYEEGTLLTQKELDKKFNFLQTNLENDKKLFSRIQTKYVLIKALKDKVLPTETDQLEVYDYADCGEDITKLVMDVINDIYGRIDMSENAKKSEELFDLQNGVLTINFNVPVTKATVFLQSKGEAELYSQRSATAVLNPKSDSAQVMPITFQGTSKNPAVSWPQFDESSIQYMSLSGAVLNYGSKDCASGTIIISGLSDISAEDIEVYYELGVQQIIKVQMGDQEPVKLEELQGQSGQAEIIGIEGDITITEWYADLDGDALDNPDSLLLKREEGVNVFLDNVSLRAEGNSGGGGYVYTGRLTETDDEQIITITNSIGFPAQKVKVPKVLPPNIELEVQLVSDIELVLDKVGTTELCINIIDVSDKPVDITESVWKNRITLTCTSNSFNTVEKEACTFNEDGTITIPLQLSDINQHKLISDTFCVMVKMSYEEEDQREAVNGYGKFDCDITSGDHVLSAELEDNTLVSTSKLLFSGDVQLPVVLFCDGDILEQNHLDELVISDYTIFPQSELLSYRADRGALILHGGGWQTPLKILRMFKWLVYGEKSYTVTFIISYDKWNNPLKNEPVELTVNLEPPTTGDWGRAFFTVFEWIIIIVCIGRLVYLDFIHDNHIALSVTFQFTNPNNNCRDILLQKHWNSIFFYYLNPFLRWRRLHLAGNWPPNSAEDIDLYITKVKRNTYKLHSKMGIKSLHNKPKGQLNMVEGEFLPNELILTRNQQQYTFKVR